MIIILIFLLFLTSSNWIISENESNIGKIMNFLDIGFKLLSILE